MTHYIDYGSCGHVIGQCRCPGPKEQREEAAALIDSIQPTASDEVSLACIEQQAQDEEQQRQDATRFRVLDRWNQLGRLFPQWRGDLRTWVDGAMALNPEGEKEVSKEASPPASPPRADG